ncbi:cell adhesion molecule Dscam1-like isoform X4 [Dermatophagoides pteronyssinus]|uniref:cell adhesion molecule Dscam1-like isoform X4 n=1 Tax=Dermatophagoides pteronyssinus TaxID=6956 RepID=UPI003F6810AF
MYLLIISIILSSTFISFISCTIPSLAPFKPNESFTIGQKFKLFCYPLAGIRPFQFEWFKNDYPLLSSSTSLSNNHYIIEQIDDASVFTIETLQQNDLGNYSCKVQNHFGYDIQSTILEIKVPPTWIVEPKDVHTNGKESFRLECKADGSPKPTIKWITSKGITIESEYLDVNKYRTANVDSYECLADNGVGEPLRKSIKVSFMVPVKFHEKFASLKVKRGESARLECNATGDQPLTVQWTKNNVKLDKLGSNYEIIDTNTDDGIRSELFIQTSQTNDAAVYKCFVENEHGKDERTIRLEVVEVPGMPKNVHVKEVWSRTVSLAWSEPFNGNLPIQKYTIQYWRYQSAPHRLNEVFVPGSQSSFFLKDLSPGQSYELSVIAENEIGKGASSAPVTFTTGEEEPSAPPNDIAAESMGPSTIRVTWRSPPIENWNGEIKGYYVGYRKVRDNNAPYVYITVPTTAAGRDSNQAQKARPKEITFHEYFLRQLNKGTEYSIVVKAYNSAGSGPQSHPMTAHTFDGDLPPSFQLNVIDSTEETISLQWYQKLHGSNYPQSAISGYTIHYRKENEAKWKEVPISNNNANQPTVDPNSSFNSYSFVLENLEPNANYMIYVAAINRFGVGDPSNLITTRTQNGMAVVSHEIIRRFHGANYYLEPMFLWPLLIALVIIVIVMIVAYVCIRKTRNANNNPFNLDAATLNKRLSAAYNVGTTPRYADFEKTANKTLLMSIDGQPPTSAAAGGVYPTPYATLPMGAETPWERPLPNPQTMKKDGHIYDHPQ